MTIEDAAEFFKRVSVHYRPEKGPWAEQAMVRFFEPSVAAPMFPPSSNSQSPTSAACTDAANASPKAPIDANLM